MKIEKIGQKAGAATAIILLILLLGGFVDNRYASADQVEQLFEEIKVMGINAIEAQILQIEYQIMTLQVKISLSEVENLMLQTLQNNRSRLLRKLSVLQGNPSG